MLVEVLMSSYNGEKYIEKQIESILDQKEVEIKLLVRDDGSTDSTTDILDRKMKDGVLTWFSGGNLKPALSFMDLLKNAPKADYYAFSDQDDIWDLDKMISAVNCLKKYDDIPAYYYCNARLIDQKDEPIGGTVYKQDKNDLNDQSMLQYLCCGGCMGCTMVMNKKLVEIIQQSPMPQKIIMHDNYIQSVCAAIDGKAIYDKQAHMEYRQHTNNVVGRKSGLWNALLYRLDFLLSQRSISIADQSDEIMKYYGKYIPDKNKKYLKCVVNYKKKFSDRMKLATSSNIKFDSKLNEGFMRLSLLLGKR